MAGGLETDSSEEAYLQIGVDHVPGYIEEHEAARREAEENPRLVDEYGHVEELVFTATLEPGKGGEEEDT